MIEKNHHPYFYDYSAYNFIFLEKENFLVSTNDLLFEISYFIYAKLCKLRIQSG